jgi:hypothetical protein
LANTNSGTLISSFNVTITLNGSKHSETLTGLDFTGNTTRDFALKPVTLRDGVNSINTEISEPGGNIDFFPNDNQLERTVIVNNASDEIPARENFEAPFDDRWVRVNPTNGSDWETVDVNSSTALVASSFSNSTLGDQSWLVSPVLDFSQTEEAMLNYDRSYALRKNTNDSFYILASIDCGYSFTDTLYKATGSRLADNRTSESSWVPATESDWRTVSLKLPSLVGLTEVRIAMVFVNGQGNNFYLDNIEFFVSDDVFPKIEEEFLVYPNPVANGEAQIAFNLPEKGDVVLDIVDAMGKVLLTEQLPGILNQTFPFNFPVSSGIYLVRITTDEKVYYRKIIITR